ncbi:MAG: arginine--tRNA ligase [Elusimicrobia bacterium]|nr:MAG: arginine--tRNA ligase [Elusimicrobiota bacterium]
MILERLQKDLESRLHAWAKSEGVDTPTPVLLKPAPDNLPDFDLSTPWPLSMAKPLKSKPLEVAQRAALTLEGIPVSATPPGFINIKLSPETLAENLKSLIAAPGDYGKGEGSRNINLEFVSANPTGPVHVASARAATLGDSLARILKHRGHAVHTEFYVNDAGRQVETLGLSVKARYDQAKGKDAEIPEGGYLGDYIKDIAAKAPQEAEQWDAAAFGQFAIELNLAGHKTDMENFGVTFDRWFLESELHEEKALDLVLKKLKGLGKVYEKDGATWLDTGGEDGEDDKDRVLIRNDGRPTYFLADIAYHQDKINRGAKELIDIWGADHHGYLPRMKDAITALGYAKGTFQAIIHQLVKLLRGKEVVKMSKRAGDFVTLRELVEEAGLDATRYFFAMRTPNAHMNFDIELAKKKSNENPVFYVQYVHARVCSIFREAKDRGVEGEASDAALAALDHPTERALLLKLAWFAEVLRGCEKELSPTGLATYLGELAGLYHKFYEQCHVLDTDAPDKTKARLTLCAGVRALIAEALGLLGVSAPERM